MAVAGTLTLDPVYPGTAEPGAAPPPATPPSPAPSDRTSRAVLGAAAMIIVAGGAIRFAALSGSIWFDESVSVRDVNGSFSQMLHKVVNHEASPPFYFICLWIWRHLVGSTAVDLRTLSALAGTLTIALAFYVARRHVGQRAALLLAALVAVSPVLIYFSTEMRMYGLLILITGVGFEAFLRSSESPNRWNFTVWAGASLLALSTQYYSALVVVPEAAWLIALAWRRRPRHRGTAVAVGAVALGALPLIYLASYQTHHAWEFGQALLSSTWQQAPLGFNHATTVAAIATDVVAGPGGTARAVLTELTLVLGGAALLLLLRHPQPTNRQVIRTLVFITPALVAVGLVLHQHLPIQGRYLLPLWLPLGLATSYALTSASAGWLGLVLGGVLVCVWLAMSVVGAIVPKFAARDDTLGAARSLGVAATDRLIAINEAWDVAPLEDYRPQASGDTRPVVYVRELDVVAMPLGGEPPPAEHVRPLSLGIGRLPAALRLVQTIRGPTFLLERFVSLMPVAIRVNGLGSAFSANNWRFLREPAGGRIGAL